MDYSYENLAQEPCLDFVATAIFYSETMTNKTITGQRFDWLNEEMTDGTLVVTFQNELSVDDKALLDGFVTASLGKVRITKCRQEIMREILYAAMGDQVQLGRLLDALDNYTSIPVALDNCNYPLARQRVLKCEADGAITEADRILVFQFIPEEEFEVPSP
jgi:hypothetical protein